MGTNRNYVNSVHVTSGVNQTAEATLTIGNMVAGDVAVMKVSDGSIVPTNAAGVALGDNELVKIVSGLEGGGIRYSKAFSRNSLQGVSSKKYEVGTTQETYVGYNGTDGTIPFAASTEYRLEVEIKHRQRIRGLKVGGDAIYITTPSTGVSALSTAMQFAELFDVRKSNSTYKDYGYKFVDLKVVSDGTFSASDNNVVVVGGSNVITFATAAAHSGGTDYAVGDYIRLGGPATTVAVYQVDEVNGLEITLNRPYLGDSETILAANSGILDSSANAGFRITGMDQEKHPIDTFEWLRFTTRMGTGDPYAGEPAVIVRDTAVATPGNGVPGQVCDAEYFAAGYEGVQSRRNFWDAAINPLSMVDTAGKYHVVSTSFLVEADDQFQNKRSFPCKADVFIKTGAAETPVDGEQAYNASDEFLHILSGVTGVALSVQV